MKSLVRVERARRDMTQADLAEALGCNRHTINALETKRYVPNGLLLLRIAKFFRVKAEDIFILEEDEQLFPDKFNDKFD